MGEWVNGWVNGRLTEAPEGANWCLRGGAAASRAAAEVCARAQPDAPPQRRGLTVGLIAKVGIGCSARAAGGPAVDTELELAIVGSANALIIGIGQRQQAQRHVRTSDVDRSLIWR